MSTKGNRSLKEWYSVRSNTKVKRGHDEAAGKSPSPTRPSKKAKTAGTSSSSDIASRSKKDKENELPTLTKQRQSKLQTVGGELTFTMGNMLGYPNPVLRAEKDKKITVMEAQKWYHLTKENLRSLRENGRRQNEEQNSVYPTNPLYEERDIELFALKKFGGSKGFLRHLVNKKKKHYSYNRLPFTDYPPCYGEAFELAVKKAGLRGSKHTTPKTKG